MLDSFSRQIRVGVRERTLRVAMIEEDLSIRSGSRRFLCEATPRLEALGHEVKLYTLRMDAKTCFPELLHLPVEITPVRDSGISVFFKRTLRRDPSFYWNHAKAVMEMSRRIAAGQPDVVIFHYAGEIWLPPYFYHLDKPAGVVCFHVLPRGIHPFPVTRFREKFDQKITSVPPLAGWKTRSLKKLSMILAHSRYVYDQVLKIRNDGQTLKGKVFPLGVNHTVFHPTGDEEPFVLCLARIHPQKRLELAVQAMQDSPNRFSLVLAGDVEDRYIWYKEQLQELASSLRLKDRVRIVPAPSSTEVVRLLQKCAVFAFPSLNETFGVSVLEAMACGKPVVANRSGGVPELLNECGLLLDPDPQQWREAVYKLLKDPNMRNKMGKKAVDRAQSYSWENTVDALVQTCSDVVKDSKSAR